VLVLPAVVTLPRQFTYMMSVLSNMVPFPSGTFDRRPARRAIRSVVTWLTW
jgi:hypothetical protein